jgi:signal peptidase I
MKKFIQKWAAPVLCGLIIFLLFKFVLFFGYVPSTSMEPTIKAGSFIAGYRVINEINRGDILVFKHGNYFLVKRVAAVEGDLIYIDCTGTIISFNEEQQDAARILEVPGGCYFMLGDNTNDSVDSRKWKDPFIKREQIIAKLW